MANVEFNILSKPMVKTPNVAVFAIVRNEMYFLPRLLEHYRALGAGEFWFLDDNSTDGSRQYLLSQTDCGVITSNYGFGDLIEGQRFGTRAKELLPQNLFKQRWVLTVDADEFLELPAELPNLDLTVGWLQRHGYVNARALMVDFFPTTLAELDRQPRNADLAAACPWFDVNETIDWPDGSSQPIPPVWPGSVRPRMYRQLLGHPPSTDALTTLEGYRYANQTKIPLMFWTEDTRCRDSHFVLPPPRGDLRLVLRHYKFYPGWTEKLNDALHSKAYWNHSMEYRFLDLYHAHLRDMDLRSPRSVYYRDQRVLQDTGLIHFGAHKTSLHNSPECCHIPAPRLPINSRTPFNYR